MRTVLDSPERVVAYNLATGRNMRLGDLVEHNSCPVCFTMHAPNTEQASNCWRDHPPKRTADMQKIADSKPVAEVVFRRARQPSLVKMLDKFRNAADAGEIVGALLIVVDKDGNWYHQRDLFNSDSPELIGYIEIVKQNLVHRYLTGDTLASEDYTGPDAG